MEPLTAYPRCLGCGNPIPAFSSHDAEGFAIVDAVNYCDRCKSQR